MYVYIQTEKGLWTVGHYDPKNNHFISESDWNEKEMAVERVHYLNRGEVNRTY